MRQSRHSHRILDCTVLLYHVIGRSYKRLRILLDRADSFSNSLESCTLFSRRYRLSPASSSGLPVDLFRSALSQNADSGHILGIVVPHRKPGTILNLG